jgi:hypothetical protein
MDKITEPGLYQDFPEEAYHADPCPEPSASRSIIKTIVERTPRHAFIAHPRLDPNFERPDPPDRFDLGTAIHTALLGRGGKIAEAPFENWTTKASKEFRAAAREQGLVPMLTDQMKRVNDMADAVREQLPDFGMERLFNRDHGRAEVVAAWQDPVGGWSRCLIDWLDADLTITDVKSTEIELGDMDALGRHCSSMGYEVQHAFYERALVNLYPEMEGRVKFRFLFCEVKAPYAILPVVLPNDAIAKGRATVAKGMELWAAAKASGKWPRFSGAARIADYPPWSVAEYAK